MMSCHLIPTWHEWNANTGDVMVTWFTSYAKLVTSHWPCVLCMHLHGTNALNKIGMPKYVSGLAFMQADWKLGKLTTTHFRY